MAKQKSGSHSSQSVTVLATNDQSGTKDTWKDYIEFDVSTGGYSGVFTFKYVLPQTPLQHYARA